MKKSTTLKEAIGWLIIGVVVLYLAHMAGYLTAEPAGAAPRRTPVPTCETIAEGVLRCGRAFATSEARPGQRNVPRRGTPTPRGK